MGKFKEAINYTVDKVISYLPPKHRVRAAVLTSLGSSILAACGGAATSEQPVQPTLQIVTPTSENRFAGIDPKSEAGQAAFFSLMDGCEIVTLPLNENPNAKVIKFGFAVVADRKEYSETSAQLVEGPVAAQDIAPESFAGLELPGETVNAMMLVAIARDQTRQEIITVSTQIAAVRRYVPNIGVPFSEAPQYAERLILEPNTDGYLNGFYLEKNPGSASNRFNFGGVVSYTGLKIVPTVESTTANCDYTPQEVLKAAELSGAGL